MNELQLTIEEMQIFYMEQKVQQLHPNAPDRAPQNHSYDTEEELFDRLIALYPMQHIDFVMTDLSARQRASFWDRVRVVNAYDYEGATEREYMIIYKKHLYNKYLNQ